MRRTGLKRNSLKCQRECLRPAEKFPDKHTPKGIYAELTYQVLELVEVAEGMGMAAEILTMD